MPSDLAMKALNVMHQAVLKVSGGRVGWSAANMPVLELTTTGRKSGQARTVLLTSPLQHGEDVMIVASKGGNEHHPAWYLNLCEHPEVSVVMGGGPPRPYRATVADSERRRELWAEIIAAHDNYAGYQTKTDREIPVVVLTPVGS